ncbi:MAG: rolling circle replication-associated protein [Clostridium sp.]|uniref:rolling circle replication-associated protein n=1 Tax=Clostridium sp. TaxID=1506 RepID=UPI003EE4936C
MIYNLKIIKCGNRVEIYKYTNYIVREQGEKEEFYRFIERDPIEKQLELTLNQEDEKENYRVNNLNKSRNKIVRLIKCNQDMQTFITLTFAKETDYKESKKYLNTLFNKLRRDIKGFKYIWVLEYGDLNGRLHYHLLCNYPINIKLSRSNKRKTKAHKELENNFCRKYWKYGFVDIRALEQEGNSNIALYVSSYIVKSLGNKNLEGYRIFGYSNKTLNKPIEFKLLDKRGLEEILNEYSVDYRVTYNNSYDVGYVKNGEERKGKVSYFDMEVRE